MRPFFHIFATICTSRHVLHLLVDQWIALVFVLLEFEVTYALVSLGESLREPMWALRIWDINHMSEVETARNEYDQTSFRPIQEETAMLVE